MKWTVFIFTLLLVTKVFAGGDLGGGGTAGPKLEPFTLTPQEIQVLANQQDAMTAYVKWLESIDDTKNQKLLKDVFKVHILPQIKK